MSHPTPPPEVLEAHPLEVLDVETASLLQFSWVETVALHFSGASSLDTGDLGVREPSGRPHTTARVEAALADMFHAEDAVMVRGSGTGAIRSSFFAAFDPGSTILVHSSPVYDTTAVTIRAMGLVTSEADFHELDSLRPSDRLAGALVAHSRQLLSDHYDPGAVITRLKDLLGDKPVVVDDNYAVAKVKRIGVEHGADLSTFSAFKLAGPEGVGVICGAKPLVDRIRNDNLSGGCQVQGHEAMATLRGLISTPVLAAVQGRVANEVADRLEGGEIPGVCSAVSTNNAETIVVVRLDEPVAVAVIEAAARHGAAPHPVGAESRYELAPLVYRVSKSMLNQHPSWRDWLIRINPNRAGADHIIRVLAAAISEARTA